ncbi:uncharacterized protein Z520_11614 [Fonsecaea multimorphosa CBS 102226]|uniref:Carbonic anhydrase n=1 Tax=Fonsecaea multimorphosa CBS 102226 TaxID=1442371 RepID=A0A0D2JHU0_9EURO|nr:uncharacterized protein Z520_11614 [Fonsecaea multimorphosa CBS 102226]KIX92762.1 hypothetical protein Z520_11614 [Fonsecaea multimorphosa CBS 102226]OAL18001.1 hypothetical protein AYO22_11157 [Fonsecaea multimorphosa]
MVTTAQDIIDRHAATLKEHKPIPTFAEMQERKLEMPHILIISCADPRCIPENIFNLKTGEVVVCRVAGGNAQLAVNSLLSIDTLLNFTDVIIVQHTNCGATMYRDNVVKGELRKRAPNLEAEINNMEFYEITGSLQANVKKSMTFLKESPFVPESLKSNIRGFVFHLDSGELEEVTL